MLSRLLTRTSAHSKADTNVIDMPPFTIHVRPHPRARSFTLRHKGLYKGSDHHFTVTVPKRISRKATIQFLHDHMEWMHTQIRAAQIHAPETRDGHLLIADAWRRIIHTEGAGVHVVLHDTEIHVTCRQERLPRALQRFIRQHALETISRLAHEKAARIDRRIESIAVRDTTSRWGSCSHDGKLSFSWRLIMAPTEVIDYVVAHEVAHLEHFDHSKDFWELCRMLSTHYTKGKHWLKLNGPKLHMMDV